MLMAGLDGVQNKIHPGDPIDKICTTCPRRRQRVQNVCSSLDMAIDHMTGIANSSQGWRVLDDMLDAYCALKMEEVTRFSYDHHPVEFEHVLQLVRKGVTQTFGAPVGDPIQIGGTKCPRSAFRPFSFEIRVVLAYT